jgi:hypothetical protein
LEKTKPCPRALYRQDSPPKKKKKKDLLTLIQLKHLPKGIETRPFKAILFPAKFISLNSILFVQGTFVLGMFNRIIQ